MAGAFIPFLFWNAPPAKVFMGDVGSLPIGAFFGACAAKLVLAHSYFQTYDPGFVGGYSYGSLLVPVLIVSVVMIIELVPVPMQVGYYKLTKKRIFPMTPIHHSFEVKGWPETRVAWSFILFQLLLVVLALAYLSAGGPWKSSFPHPVY
jgi:phospho-N-acetylmuramoyl-pentapeptide-transferase